MDEIFFFDDKMNLLARHKLDRTLYMPFVRLNAEETYVIVSNGVSGDFYFFTIDGKLERKGIVKDVTGDGGTSYSKNSISSTGKYWLLSNNIAYLFEKDNLLSKLYGYNFYINEKSNLIIYLQNLDKIIVKNINSDEVKYYFNSKNFNVLNIEKRIIEIQNLKNNKIYKYEINL
ncbi:MAG: hypothetical protein R2771_08530 [Saprospiraceae bacterium]